MHLIRNVMTPILPKSCIMCPDRIEELNLFDCDRSVPLKLPSLVHINFIDSFDALQSCSSLSMNTQSITIVTYHEAFSVVNESLEEFTRVECSATITLVACPHL